MGRSCLSARGWDCALGRAALVCAALLAALSVGRLAEAAIAGRQLVVGGLAEPIFAMHAPGDPNRLFIAERGEFGSTSTTSNIRIFNRSTGVLESAPFLSIPDVNATGEGGLLGIAFHPNYATNGKFYVYLTASDSIEDTAFSAYIREYTVSANANVANTNFTPVLTWPHPQNNHDGGFIGFSPLDHKLYIMFGDGGSGNDVGTGHSPEGNAQDTTDNLLGKALRIDVDGDDFPGDAERNYRIPDSNPFADMRDVNRVVTSVVAGDDEIWAYGLRNPFRAGFDRATGDLWIGDVGQDWREEVDYQPASSAGGENYGWRLREGFIETPGVGGPKPPGAVDPIWDYKQRDAPDVTPTDANFTGESVVGGVPYRGPDPSLQGVYFFADAASSRVWTLRQPAGGGAPVVEYINPLLGPGFVSQPVAITEDSVGNLYITELSGSVYRILTNELMPGDFNADARVNGADLGRWTTGAGTTSGATAANGDADGDGDVDGMDFLAWQRNLGWSAVGAAAAGTSVPEPEGVAAVAIVAATLSTSPRRHRVLAHGGAVRRRSRMEEVTKC